VTWPGSLDAVAWHIIGALHVCGIGKGRKS
jgi:hypothetical protein